MYCKVCHRNKKQSYFSVSYHYKGKPIYRKTCKKCQSKQINSKYPHNITIIDKIRSLNESYVKSRMKKAGIPTDNAELVELYKQNMKLKRLIYGNT